MNSAGNETRIEGTWLVRKRAMGATYSTSVWAETVARRIFTRVAATLGDGELVELVRPEGDVVDVVFKCAPRPAITKCAATNEVLDRVLARAVGQRIELDPAFVEHVLRTGSSC